MGQARALVVGCVLLFAVPFCAAGLFIIFGSPHVSGAALAMRIAAGSVFLLGGLLLGGGAIYITRSHPQPLNLYPRDPQQPWTWREDWRSNAIHDQGAVWIGVMWFFTLIWNLISFPVVLTISFEQVRVKPVLGVVFLFPAAGALLLITVTYVSVRRMKFGASICHVDSVPIVPGRRFHGEIETRVREAPPNGFQLRLTCVRSVITGTSRSRTATETILWQDDRTVMLPTPSYEGLRVAFSFEIPPDAPPTDMSVSNDRVFWRLHAEAEVPGVDYAATFDMPVFATGTQHREIAASWPAPHANVEEWQPAAESRIVITPLPNGGDEFRIGPMQGGGGLTYVVFMFVWTGAIWLMFDTGMRVVPAVFSLVGFVFILAGIDWWFGRSTVRASRDGVTIRRAWFGIGAQTRTIPASEVSNVIAAISNTQRGAAPYYEVRVVSGEREVNVGPLLRAKRDAEMLAARMRKDVGVGATPA